MAQLGFRTWIEVAQRPSIADLFPIRADRSGICVLGFANGDRYVGRTIDVVRRLAQHRKNHPDIVSLAFLPVPFETQADTETNFIHTLERCGAPLRNLRDMSTVTTGSDLDDLVSPEEQRCWVADLFPLTDAEVRTEDAALRRRYGQRYQEFCQQPRLSRLTVDVLRCYIPRAVPAPLRTERTFWSLTCLPAPREANVLARLNVNMQEVLTIQAAGSEIGASIHLARSPFVKLFGPSWLQEIRHAGFVTDQHAYRPGGHDQFNVITDDAAATIRFLDWPVAQSAIRLLNLNLMRKGPSFFANYHCFDLADAAFAPSGVGAERPPRRRQRPLQPRDRLLPLRRLGR